MRSRLIFVCIMTLVIGAGHAQEMNHKKFPKQRLDDYDMKGYYARLGISIDQTKARILVKGSKIYPFFRVNNNSIQKLLEPNYVINLDVDPGEINIDFSNDGKIFDQGNHIVLHAESRNQIEKPEPEFSMIFYGCFDPFELNKKKELVVVHDKFNMNYLSRQLFAKISSNGSLSYYQAYRDTLACVTRKRLKASIYCFEGSNPSGTKFSPKLSSSSLISKPRIIIGNGDQVYVDAGYSKYHKNNVCCEIGEKPQFKLSINEHQDYMNDLYLASGSFDFLNEAFNHIPTIGVWDDHEIRDGWGSQRDEYYKDQGKWVMNETLKPYYNIARRAYVEHQFNLGNNLLLVDNYLNNKELHQELIVGGKKIFAFDLRSERNINEPRVISEEQLRKFNNWVDNLSRGEEAVIISSIPVSFTFKDASEKFLYKIDREMRDDLSDSWGWVANRPQRDLILKKILEKRIKDDVRIYIVSGDLHLGSAIELWYAECDTNWNYERETGKVLAYELISSAVSHETKQTTGSPISSIMHASEKQRQNEDVAFIVTSDARRYVIKSIVNISEPRLNFGAIDFKKDETSLNVFLMGKKDAQQYILKADWSKTDIQERRLEGITTKTKIYQGSGKYRKTYIAPIPHVLRNIQKNSANQF